MNGSRRSAYSSPIQRFRRANQDEDGKIVINYKVTPEKIPTFFEVRNFIFPIVKPWNWIKRARESLQSAVPKTMLMAKQLSNLNLGVLYGLYFDGQDLIRYVSSADLSSWQINEKELARYAKENLIKKIGLIEKLEPLFSETQTGIFYCNKLKSLTSSLLAVPDVFNMIPFKTNNYVVLCPSPEILFVSHCHDSRGLCLIGELSLRYGQRETIAPLSAKPIRISKGGLSAYEASIVRNESPVPCNEDQLRTCKKSVFKKSRKLSTTSS